MTNSLMVILEMRVKPEWPLEECEVIRLRHQFVLSSWTIDWIQRVWHPIGNYRFFAAGNQ